MKTIITIQHTESIHHSNGMIGSWTDWELSEKGHQQAKRLAERLAPTIASQKWLLYSSDLKRAQQTARYLAKSLEIELHLREELRERNLGEAVGKSVKWFQDRLIPEETVYDRLIPSAESRSELWERLVPIVHEIDESEQENFILVSHGDCLSVFNAVWLGLEKETLNTMDFYGQAGGVSFLYDEGRKKRIRRLSDMSFVTEFIEH
ncbi:hypothetical protein DOK78_001938 [Enterococcus sp. DIV2402]|uniref:Histidine phosphatase family protein n=1 Tax=Candidatus Enterococcus lowellii TaxID=2230877 RepID=A0ABZ2SQM7_9ENTE|nr:histidine phosphatase family protein [Enterococcus sp. DIV2402]MBO0463931.1 histidine phosphatase family protein [Enterococcus sp. DIV2402]